MISPMLKYQFLVFYREGDELLRLFKDAGVVHIRRLKREEDEQTLLLKRRLTQLKQYKTQFERVLPESEIEDSALLDDFRLQELPELFQELESSQKVLAQLEEERYHYRLFGDYNARKIDEIESRGLHFHLFSVALGKIKSRWREEYALEPIFDSSRKSYFVILSDTAQVPVIKAQIEAFPARSVAELEVEIASIAERRRIILQTLFVLRNNIRRYLDEEMVKCADQLQERAARTQMLSMGFGKVTYLQGWIPEERAAALEALLDTSGIYYERDKPEPKDAPPVLLRNTRGARLFEPIAKLFDLPAYTELDLTPFFAPFFLLFFGLCLGDGGYGILLFIVLLLLGRKVPIRFRGLWKLALMLEAGAAVLGLLSGTFFGINLFESYVPGLSQLQPYMLNSDQLFTASLILGAVQILFGLTLKAYNNTIQYGILYAIAPVGWMILLTALGAGYLTGFALWLQVAAWSGVGLIMLFSDPKAGMGTRLGKGLWELYGITGYFGDLLSYIRLFALGLAGSILGFVVNDIALSILRTHSIIGPIFFVLMLLVGHSLNIFIASLGAFVHPMRLTFVEFYKNAGFHGGGEMYQPLRHLPSPPMTPAPGAPQHQPKAQPLESLTS